MTTQPGSQPGPRAGPRASPQPGPRDVLGESGLPLIHSLQRRPEQLMPTSENRYGQSVRLWARSLDGMQKEAFTLSAQNQAVWRLASDEGPYLRGFDSAPCPLAFFTTGLVASCTNEVIALAAVRNIPLRNTVLRLDSFYAMAGSAPQRTMRASADAPHLLAFIDSEASEAELTALLQDAVAASPVCALLRNPLVSRFALTVNGTPDERVEADSVASRALPSLDFEQLRPTAGDEARAPLVERLRQSDTVHGVTGGFATSLAPAQDRGLHIRGTCRSLPDGTREIRQELFSPIGSSYRFISDEAPGRGGQGRAPDAAAYAAAGIGFCFMTQLGRFARIVRQELGDYRIIQDLHLSVSPGTPGVSGDCDPVETHLQLEGPISADFARELLLMGEQTCFLHALCRHPLNMTIELQRGTCP